MQSNPNATFTRPKGFVKAGDQLFVTVGLNVGRHPMSKSLEGTLVYDLQQQIEALLRPSASFGPFRGQGSWVDEESGDTIEEESLVFSFTVGYTTKIEHLERTLEVIARVYRQDAIAWTSGTGNLARR